jgi:hypothetical protein
MYSNRNCHEIILHINLTVVWRNYEKLQDLLASAFFPATNMASSEKSNLVRFHFQSFLMCGDNPFEKFLHITVELLAEIL